MNLIKVISFRPALPPFDVRSVVDFAVTPFIYMETQEYQLRFIINKIHFAI